MLILSNLAFTKFLSAVLLFNNLGLKLAASCLAKSFNDLVSKFCVLSQSLKSRRIFEVFGVPTDRFLNPIKESVSPSLRVLNPLEVDVPFGFFLLMFTESATIV